MSDGAPRFYLQWNLVNWITITLMFMSGMIVVGFIASGIRQYSAKSRATGTSDD